MPPYEQAYRALLAIAAGNPGLEYVPLSAGHDPARPAPVKLIAFYLPQFHPIPENDAWWGTGFTEWTNVSKAVPQFLGHHQPQLPGELGFYDLRVPDVERRQVELARRYGIFGFCFYYYWFGGTRLLERPLEQFIADPEIDFPFCLCWANENWTRRWDGYEDDVLIAQDHSDESDSRFIADIAPMFRHKNYIRIHGRPLLLVYRPFLLPSPGAAAARWRAYCRDNGLADPYLVAAQSFESIDPAEIGFDAAVEFPPNTGNYYPFPDPITSQVPLLNQDFAGTVYRYADLMQLRIDRPSPPYELFKNVCPGWDNASRRPGHGVTFAFSSPASYRRWLETACRSALATSDPEKRLVFINAWNEWGEGAHLEPDRRYGYAFLDATAQALRGLDQPWTILFVSHDACRGGAQLVLLELLAWLKAHTSIRLKVLCLAGGEWLPRFQELGDTLLMQELEDKAAQTFQQDVASHALDFCGGRPGLIYGNSVASGRAYDSLSRLNAPIVTHVHELETSIVRSAGACIGDVLDRSAHYIACSDAVRDNLIAAHQVAPDNITTVHTFADAAAMAEQAAAMTEDAALRRPLGSRAREKVSARFTTAFAAPHVLSTCRKVADQKPAVSVIVPNYNHGRYLPARLASIFSQTFRDVEVIILDDASTDNSSEVIEEYRDHADVRIISNQQNSGSTFKQWVAGIESARADIVWIAESDDESEPTFVEALLPALRDPRVRVAYANSHVIDSDGTIVGEYTNCDYLTSLSTTKWNSAYQVTAEQEINEGLGVKNTILSASSVLFKKFDLNERVRRQLEEMRIAGDWYFFVHAMADGEIYYTPAKLNRYRRHAESVVGRLQDENRAGHFFAEFYTVQSAIFANFRLHDGFERKWEEYLREQWNAFFPGRPFDELMQHYPIDRAREQIMASSAPALG